MITATLRDIETGDTETENFASFSILEVALDESDMIVLDHWKYLQGDCVIASSAMKGNAEPELREFLCRRGELQEDDQ